MLIGKPLVLRRDPSLGQRDIRRFAFIYVGRGHVKGIPRRNLTHDEADVFGWELLRGIQCCHTGQKMYREVV